MLIQHKLLDGKGLFYIGQDGNIVGELVYTTPSPDKMVIEHTEVHEALRGKQAGFQLVQTAVEYARKHAFTIIPLCPFARVVFDKHPEFADVLDRS